MSKVMIGLSGGVDSSISAYLLQKDGYEVEGVYMKLHNLIDGYHEQNIKAVKQVSQFLGIKYHILDLTCDFKQTVYDYFVQSYKNGITPNPCVMCNRTIKFGALYDFAMDQGCDFLATGHYAKTDGKYIYEAHDKSKDQSYFLAQINQAVLQNVIFPMSLYTKEKIKDIASNIKEFEDIAKQKDSQEICFVEGEYTDILKKHIDIDIQGDTLDEVGNVIGHHKGYMHYTIGKRKGFYVHGAHVPHFVKSIDHTNNTIVATTKDKLNTQKVTINNLNIFDLNIKDNLMVKLRYRSVAIPCVLDISNDNQSANIILKQDAFGVANGQIAVVYMGDMVVLSGVIIGV